MEALLVLFDKRGERVLMCKEKSGAMLDFPHITIKELEQPNSAALRCLDTVLDIPSNCVGLEFVRHETIARRDGTCSSVHVMCGIVNIEKEYSTEDLLFWMPVSSLDIFTLNSARNGSCFVYLKESCRILESR